MKPCKVGHGTDTLFVTCLFCRHEVTISVPCGKDPSPSQTVRMYERMIAHLRKEHVGKRGGS